MLSKNIAISIIAKFWQMLKLSTCSGVRRTLSISTYNTTECSILFKNYNRISQNNQYEETIYLTSISPYLDFYYNIVCMVCFCCSLGCLKSSMHTNTGRIFGKFQISIVCFSFFNGRVFEYCARACTLWLMLVVLGIFFYCSNESYT